MPAANDLLQQQIGWQGKDVRLTARESLSASASTFSEVLRRSEWHTGITVRARHVLDVTGLLTSLSHMSNGQFANATPCYRCESCYLTTLQPFKLLNSTTIKYSELERMWQGLPWSRVRHWTGNCLLKTEENQSLSRALLDIV
jgi:hypothetical protein